MDAEPVTPTDGGGVSVALVIVDPNPVIREGLPRILPRLWACSAAADWPDLFSQLVVGTVVLLDPERFPQPPARMGGLDGAIAAVADAGSRLLIYTADQRRYVLARCLAAGAVGVVSKLASISELVTVIAEVSRTGKQSGCELDPTGAGPGLSRRQLEVLGGRARGESFPQMAARLGIAAKTAAEYVATVSNKFPGFLDSHSPADLERELGLGPGDVFDWRDSVSDEAPRHP